MVSKNNPWYILVSERSDQCMALQLWVFQYNFLLIDILYQIRIKLDILTKSNNFSQLIIFKIFQN